MEWEHSIYDLDHIGSSIEIVTICAREGDMGVARETILTALEALKELEEFAVANLAEVKRYDYSGFDKIQRERILHLLERLSEDTFRHEDMIDAIISRLQG